jgi:hypothetical protein
MTEGSKVEGNYRGKGKWYTGKIKKDRGDGTFDIDYDDGEFEMRIGEELIRLVGGGGASVGRSPVRAARMTEGSKVEGNYRGKGKWYPGKIKKDRGDGTFDIDYDDGEFESRVAESLLRPVDLGGNNGFGSTAPMRPLPVRSPVPSSGGLARAPMKQRSVEI